MAYKKEQIIEALNKTFGMIYLSAEMLGCRPGTIHNWVKRSPDVAAVVDHWRGKMLDVAEVKLYDKCQSGDNWAIGFVLSKLGKSRGYVEKNELDINSDINIKISYADPDHDK